MLLRVFVFLSAVSVIYAAVAIQYPVKNPYKDVEGCFIKEFNDTIPFGTAVPSKKLCMEYSCQETRMTYFSCGAVGYPEGCEGIKDETKPYPGCCQVKIVCPESDDSKTSVENNTI